jgi:hypothetical protein
MLESLQRGTHPKQHELSKSRRSNPPVRAVASAFAAASGGNRVPVEVVAATCTAEPDACVEISTIAHIN